MRTRAFRRLLLEAFRDVVPEQRAKKKRHVPVGVRREFRKIGDQLQQESGAGVRQRGDEDRTVDRHVREAAREHTILDVGHGLLESDAAKSDPVDRAVQGRVMLRPAHEAVRFQ